MENEIYSFEHLEAWKQSRKLVSTVYALLAKFPIHERFGLCDQIRRAVISVPSNIAEGNGRTSTKEKIHFIEIAYSSLMETYCLLIIAADLKYIKTDDLQRLKKEFYYMNKLLIGLRASFKRMLNQHP